jgi:hypothetical protein|tara:strand:- start:86 stop:361 length:276 start_codon:yes stop_codon:yes gene_type:complete
MEIKYAGKDYDPKVTRYNLVMGDFNGSLLKHNGQFTELDLMVSQGKNNWCVYFGNILANNKKELKEIIDEKIAAFIQDVDELVDYLQEMRE